MTSLIILFKTLSFLLSVITTLIVPSLFNDPPMTLSPSFLYIGRDSPVKSDSSTLVSPLSISPSRGIVSPGLTKITSFCFKNFVSHDPHKVSRSLTHQSDFCGMQIAIDDLVPFPVIVDGLDG